MTAVPKASYDSPLRRAQAARTRRRIVSAGADLVKEQSMWDWNGVTIGAVAERAEVNRRTVYRHFANERDLRDAVMQHLTEEAGVDFETMQIQDVRGVAATVFSYVISTPLEPWRHRDEAHHAAERRRRQALLSAVESSSPHLGEADRRMVAGLFDLLWGVESLEHLVSTWGVEAADATKGLVWLIEMLQEAVTDEGPVGATSHDRAARGRRGTRK